MSIYARRRKAKLLDQRLIYIDPLDCHSAIGYTISTTDYGGFRAQVELTDCNRKINWEFDNCNKLDHASGIAKIDRVVDILLAFRNSYGSHGTAFLEKAKKRKKK